jgi:hypothetical protein
LGDLIILSELQVSLTFAGLLSSGISLKSDSEESKFTFVFFGGYTTLQWSAQGETESFFLLKIEEVLDTEV